MKKIIQFLLFALFLLGSFVTVFAQEKPSTDPDIELKNAIYTKYKRQVQAYTKKDFDALFFEFFEKQSEEQPLLTKEEYYSYTIKIAIYSERLGLLYKDQKELSKKSKAEWFNKSYQDYSNSRPKKAN